MDSIGELLRSAREERKIPIAQVARDTKVNEKYIAAMEADEFSAFPAFAYARGFLRIYAEYLGLDSRPLLERLVSSRGGAPPQAIIGSSTDIPWMPSVVWKYAILVAGVAVAAFVLAFSLITLTRSCAGRGAARPASGGEELETLPLPPLPSAKPTLAPSVQKTPTARPSRQKKLTVRAKENVWVKAYADGVLLFQGTVSRGKEESWAAMEGFDLRVGKPGALEISMDGKPVKGLRGKDAQNISIDSEGNVKFYRGKLRAE